MTYSITKAKLASMIDHTNLKPNAKKEDIYKLCEEALKYGFASVCVNSIWVKKVVDFLKTKEKKIHVKTCAVVGFPLGACSHKVKAFEANIAVSEGAEEIDMVIDIGAIKDKRWDDVEEDIINVVQSVKKLNNNIVVKVILENCYLTREEIITACRCCEKCGADFVKTSTGFGPSGASEDDIKVMKKNISDKVKIKAAGGIRDYTTAIAMIDAGADRIGCSASVDIISGLLEQEL